MEMLDRNAQRALKVLIIEDMDEFYKPIRKSIFDSLKNCKITRAKNILDLQLEREMEKEYDLVICDSWIIDKTEGSLKQVAFESKEAFKNYFPKGNPLVIYKSSDIHSESPGLNFGNLIKNISDGNAFSNHHIGVGRYIQDYIPCVLSIIKGNLELFNEKENIIKINQHIKKTIQAIKIPEKILTICEPMALLSICVFNNENNFLTTDEYLETLEKNSMQYFSLKFSLNEVKQNNYFSKQINNKTNFQNKKKEESVSMQFFN